MNFKNSLLLFFFLFICIQKAKALDVLDYRFTNSYRYAVLEDTSSERFKGKSTATASFAHITSPFYLINTNNNVLYTEIIKNYDLVTLGGSYRVNKKFQVIAETAIVKAEVLNETETAVSDTHLKAKYILIGNRNYAFSVMPEIILASGSELSFTTRSGLGFSIRGTYEQHLGRLHLVGSIGYANGSNNTYYNINNSQLVLTELGVSLDLIKNWNINFEMVATHNLNAVGNQSTQEGDYYFTLKNRTSLDFSTYGGVGIASLSSPDKMNKTFFVGLKYTFDNIFDGSTPNVAPIIKNEANKL